MAFNLRAARFLPLALTLIGSTALAATVTLSPTGDHPQGATQVSGSGFGASEPVDIYFDTTDEVLAIADSSGNFGPDTVTIPANAVPGSHSISAVGRRTADEAQHAFLVRTRWSSHGSNNRGQRRNLYENVIDSTNVGTLAQAWSATTGNSVFSSPAVAQITSTYNPYIFAGSEDDYLYAFDSTGARVWRKVTGGMVDSSPAVSGSTVYVGSADGKLYAFKAANGSAAWAAPATTGGAITSSPTVANGIVYVGSADGKLYAFNASDGSAAWTSPAATGGPITYSTPAVADGIVYVGSTDDKMYAFDAATGAAAWSSPFATSGAIVSSPTVAVGAVYFGSEDHKYYAVNARYGSQKWLRTTGNMVTSSAAYTNGAVYIASTDGKLYVSRILDGEIRWTGTLAAGASYSSAAAANGVVYIGTSANDIEAFNAGGCGGTTCTPVWTASVGGSVNSSPAVSDGMLYFGANDHKLYAYAPSGADMPAYTFRETEHPPSRASLHPDMRLKPVERGLDRPIAR